MLPHQHRPQSAGRLSQANDLDRLGQSSAGHTHSRGLPTQQRTMCHGPPATRLIDDRRLVPSAEAQPRHAADSYAQDPGQPRVHPLARPTARSTDVRAERWCGSDLQVVRDTLASQCQRSAMDDWITGRHVGERGEQVGGDVRLIQRPEWLIQRLTYRRHTTPTSTSAAAKRKGPRPHRSTC